MTVGMVVSAWEKDGGEGGGERRGGQMFRVDRV